MLSHPTFLGLASTPGKIAPRSTGKKHPTVHTRPKTICQRVSKSASFAKTENKNANLATLTDLSLAKPFGLLQFSGRDDPRLVTALDVDHPRSGSLPEQIIYILHMTVRSRLCGSPWAASTERSRRVGDESGVCKKKNKAMDDISGSYCSRVVFME